MKKGLLLVITSLFSLSAFSVPVENSLTNATVREIPIIRNQLGTGTPAISTFGNENAVYIDDNYWHIPQYMPNFPTAATIWPRVIEVECSEKVISHTFLCNGYHWTPDMGRGEYLFLIPKPKQKSPPVIYFETPPKKKRE